ncbi:MAG TPA: SMI1/KNR4 family protein [Verrucomicrobiae bacterium]|nr:SMI1/KNR4 family protein [Verrucomicrobiae bacterium]
MNAIEQIIAAQQTKLVDEDGEPVSLELAKPLTLEQIDSLQEKIGLPLPSELRELLAFCSGIDGCLDAIDFTGGYEGFGTEEIFPKGLSVASDGFGNSWVLDITPETTKVAPVFFACHDAPVILYQSADLASFLAEVFRMNTPPHKSLVDDVHEDRLFDVWGKNPGVITQTAAAASSDPDLKAFASSLSEHFQVIDLRKAVPGMGFSWGRYGPRTEVRRHGYERIFAYAKPPKSGLFAKLFGS